MSLCGTKAAPIYLTMVINCWSVAEPSNYTLIVAKQSDATFRTVPITETSPYLIGTKKKKKRGDMKELLILNEILASGGDGRNG